MLDHGSVREGTRLWKRTVLHVRAVLDELDPYGLQPGAPDGAPRDEYDPEAERIARHLTSHGTIGADDVDAIWTHWFGEPLSGVIGDESMTRVLRRFGEPPGALREPGDAT